MAEEEAQDAATGLAKEEIAELAGTCSHYENNCTLFENDVEFLKLEEACRVRAVRELCPGLKYETRGTRQNLLGCGPGRVRLGLQGGAACFLAKLRRLQAVGRRFQYPLAGVPIDMRDALPSRIQNPRTGSIRTGFPQSIFDLVSHPPIAFWLSRK